MNIHTLKAVNASDFFQDFPVLMKILSDGGQYNFSWGDNNHSLVDIDTLVDALDDQIHNDEDEDYDEEKVAVSQADWDKFMVHVDAIPKDVYIDLEN
jgi:hypothetical protein